MTNILSTIKAYTVAAFENTVGFFKSHPKAFAGFLGFALCEILHLLF